jgi:hypothetical protein
MVAAVFSNESTCKFCTSSSMFVVFFVSKWMETKPKAARLLWKRRGYREPQEAVIVVDVDDDDDDDDEWWSISSLDFFVVVCCSRSGREGISNFPSKWIWNPRTPENV